MRLAAYPRLLMAAFFVVLLNVSLFAHVQEDETILAARSSRTSISRRRVEAAARTLRHVAPAAPVAPDSSPPPSPQRQARARPAQQHPDKKERSVRGYCVHAGYPLAPHDSVLLEATLPLPGARSFCTADPACSGFSARTDGASQTNVHVVFFRTTSGVSNASGISIGCTDSWILFLRRSSSSTFSASCDRADDAPEDVINTLRHDGGGMVNTSNTPVSSRVTVVTQLSMNRMSMLIELAERWPGPVVAAAIHEPSTPPATTALPAELAVRVQLLLRERAPDEPFPINTLRNAAIAAVRTSHFFVLDVDLWPSESLLSELGKLDDTWWDHTPRLALLVPAFQLTANPSAVRAALSGGHDPVPAGPRELRACVRETQCTAFKGQLLHPDSDPTAHAIPGQQLATDYARWFVWERRALPYRIPCFDKPSFEPYLIVRRGAHVPRFDEQFVGYGKNKVQWVQSLRAAGYAFWVLPRGFVTHVPHEQSKHARAWGANANGHKQRMDELFNAQLARQAAQPPPIGAASGCSHTPACKVPLAQFINPLEPSHSRRIPANIMA